MRKGEARIACPSQQEAEQKFADSSPLARSFGTPKAARSPPHRVDSLLGLRGVYIELTLRVGFSFFLTWPGARRYRRAKSGRGEQARPERRSIEMGYSG